MYLGSTFSGSMGVRRSSFKTFPSPSFYILYSFFGLCEPYGLRFRNVFFFQMLEAHIAIRFEGLCTLYMKEFNCMHGIETRRAKHSITSRDKLLSTYYYLGKKDRLGKALIGRLFCGVVRFGRLFDTMKNIRHMSGISHTFDVSAWELYEHIFIVTFIVSQSRDPVIATMYQSQTFLNINLILFLN